MEGTEAPEAGEVKLEEMQLIDFSKATKKKKKSKKKKAETEENKVEGAAEGEAD